MLQGEDHLNKTQNVHTTASTAVTGTFTATTTATSWYFVSAAFHQTCINYSVA